MSEHAVRFAEVNVLTQPKVLARIEPGFQPVLPLVLLDGQALRAPSPRKLAAALGLPPLRRVAPAPRSPSPEGVAVAAAPGVA